MPGLVKNYDINWTKYDTTYIPQLESCLKNLNSKVNTLNNYLKEIVMVKNVWYDEHAAAFVKWFRNVATTQLYNATYNNAITLYTITVLNTCKVLKNSYPETYSAYPKVKAYANASTIWDVIGANYKKLNSDSIFTAAQETVKKGDVTKGDTVKVNAVIEKIYGQIKSIADTADNFSKLILGFGVGNHGVKLEDFDGGFSTQSARSVTNSEGSNAKVLKGQLEYALKGSNMIVNLKK